MKGEAMGAAVLRRMLLFGLVALAAAAGPAPGQAAGPRHRRHSGGRPIVHAAQIVSDLRHGRPVLRNAAIVPERLVLTRIDTVSSVLRCTGCRFEHGIDASGVTFARTVDLAGARIDKLARFRGTTFRGPAVFGTAEECSADPGAGDQGFSGAADFSLAEFDDLASFDTATFQRPATFDDAQFRGRADFGNACFARGATFAQAGFAEQAGFTQVQVDGGVSFDGASFAKGATFLGSTLTGSLDSPAASFTGSTSAGDLDFTFVSFEMAGKEPPAADQRGNIPDVADFSYLVCTGSAFFQDAKFATGYGVAMDHVHIGDLALGVAVAPQIDDEVNQRAVLARIESSAKDRGDLAAANDAHYQDELLRSRHYHQPWRALDYVFYRGVTGYLVRPLRPILVLLGLVLLLALARVAYSAARPGVAAHRRRRRQAGPALRAGSRGVRAVLVDVLDTVALVGPRSRGTELPLGRRLEIFAYRVLVVCALLALANANPTLREMVDSLF